jgi:hypothetical protein
MRVLLVPLLTLCLAIGLLAASSPQGADATAVLAAARQALGGEQKLAAIKTFVATGRTRQIRGNSLVPIEFEIACELPDKYVRRDEIPAQESGITSSGFNGDGLVQVPPPPEPPPAGRQGGPPAASAAAPGARPGATPPAGATRTPPPPGAPPTPPSGTATGATVAGTASPSGAPLSSLPVGPGRAGGPPAPPPDPRKARVTSLKQDFVRLTLGMFAASFDSYPLTFTLAGQAEAPQGRADVVDVKGPGNFAVRLLINSQTHLPIMVSWTMPATNVVVTAPGQPAPEGLPPGAIVVQAPPAPAATAPKEEQQKYAADVQELRKKTLATAKPVEYRIYYADYRDTGGGVLFPFRLRRAIAGETVEETNFDAFRINARIDPRRFVTVK